MICSSAIFKVRFPKAGNAILSTKIRFQKPRRSRIVRSSVDADKGSDGIVSVDFDRFLFEA